MNFFGKEKAKLETYKTKSYTNNRKKKLAYKVAICANGWQLTWHFVNIL